MLHIARHQQNELCNWAKPKQKKSQVCSLKCYVYYPHSKETKRVLLDQSKVICFRSLAYTLEVFRLQFTKSVLSYSMH